EQEVLFHLVEVCKNGERGFLAAADRVNDPGLKSLFTELAAERARFAADLVPHLQRLGGRTDQEGTSAGTLHRGWIGLKSLVPGHHDHAIVIEAERGERVALNAYQDALNGMLPPTVIGLIEQQRDALQKANDRIRAIDMGYS
ncbi:MAG: PA2169 family four-helix-bundle protein, partial [Acidobacteria bacterium]|nr:PA2169 family four-helix-bundle protein [Acidobacteriota bacterium]